MALTIGIAWLALSALVVLFVYCCSRLSNGTREQMDEDDWNSGVEVEPPPQEAPDLQPRMRGAVVPVAAERHGN